MRTPEERHIDRKEIVIRGVCVAAFFTCCVLFNYFYHFRVSVSSDTTTLIPMARDVLNGNVFLKDWVLGTNNFYFTDLIWFVIGFFLHVSEETLVYLIPSITWAAMLTLIVFGLLDIFSLKRGTGILATVLIAAVLGIVGPQTSYTLLNVNSHNIVYLYFLIALFLAERYVKKRKISALISYVVLCALSAFSDGTTLEVIIAPVCMCAIISVLKKDGIKQNLVLISGNILAYLFSKMLLKLVPALGGMTTRGLPLNILSPSQWWERGKGFFHIWCQFFEISGIKTADGGVAFNVYHVLILLYLLAVIVAFVYNLLRIFKIDFRQMAVFWCAFVNLFCCVVTNVAVFNRYLAPFYIYGSVLLVMTGCTLARQFASGEMRALKSACGFKIVAGVLIVAATVIGAYKLNLICAMEPYGTDEEKLVEEIESRNWGDGYGDFWSASVLSYYSEFAADIYPCFIREDADRFIPYVELVMKSWYEETDKHYIIIKQDVGMVDADVMMEIAGTPNDILEVGAYTVYFWTEDISQYMMTYAETYGAD